ncbi:MAG: protein kinase family protein [bacterium]|nr:protein kinase family protein [bacterium]
MEEPQKTGKWKKNKELGKGGQGVVYLAVNTGIIDYAELQKAIEYLANYQYKTAIDTEHYATKLVNFMKEVDNPNNYGALKVLHKPQEGREYTLAQERIKREIEVMQKLRHPNFIKIVDTDSSVNPKWFVSKYYSKGTLSDNKGAFAGKLLTSLKAFRPIVEAVAELHKQKMVHRDIKPENVFIDQNNNLVLGDFGLIFFADEEHSRLSGTFENVGSRDWMPMWAMGRKIEDIKPTFDVFSLGKLLWAMISETPKLTAHYFKDDDYPLFNLEKMFSDKPEMKLANELFQKCIVEREKNCLSDASALLKEVDETISTVASHTNVIGKDISQKCKICGVGTYENFNIKGESIRIPARSSNGEGSNLQIFACNHCGNAQLFNKIPETWKRTN